MKNTLLFFYFVVILSFFAIVSWLFNNEVHKKPYIMSSYLGKHIIISHITNEIHIQSPEKPFFVYKTEVPTTHSEFVKEEEEHEIDVEKVIQTESEEVLPSQTQSYAHPIIPYYFSKKKLSHVLFNNTELANRCNPQTSHPCSDITMVTQLSTNRLLFLYEISKRWHGRISATLSLTPSEYRQYQRDPSSLLPAPLPPTISIVPYEHNPKSSYPVNHLRNLAIQNVQTTHFFYNDIDFLPSHNLYEELLRIPESFLLRPYTAIIVPAFEFYPKMKIDETQFRKAFNAYLPQVPTTKQQLSECMLTSPANCTIFRDKAHLHEYLISEWFEPLPSLLYEVPCLRGDRQEPYLLVQKTDSLPLYDERFVGYGWNKVQWIEHLRTVGYRFYVFNQGFIIHCPHPISNSQKQFLAKMKSVQGVWKQFIKEMKKTPKLQKGTPMCK